MKTMSTARKVLSFAFASAALAVTFLAAASPAEARYFCQWTAARGQVCTWAP